MTNLLWTTFPYIALTVFAVGHVWRYKNDQFGWTTRSSQIYESKLLRLGSPLFHFGILGVFAGHVMGIAIPSSWTDAVGVDDHIYHYVSLVGGVVTGVMTCAGIAILLYRRATVSMVRKATTTNDKAMYLVFIAVLITGMMNTIGVNLFGPGYNYRETISPWFRSLFTLNPKPELMVGVPITFQVHALLVLLLFAMWPFTRLVHMFSAPVGYLVRPYVVYRSKEPVGAGRKYGKAWEVPARPQPRKWL
ncbi:MAG: respiratory nitrate reductase subunit gamma [Nocardiaceae bacterium]|nr:respiratory nitrate reductase subunit gamma [Nocardiaceae bacterium]